MKGGNECRTYALTVFPIRIALASGGTGGHLYPGLAMAREIGRMNPNSRCLFIISEKEIEASILKSTGFSFHQMPSCSPQWKHGWRFLTKVWAGYRQARKIFEEFRPHAVVALGGYACLAPALAARSMGIPVFVQEQNCVAGRANTALSLLAKGVFAPFAGMERQFPWAKVFITGNPVRADALASDRESSLRALGLAPDKATVLVLGGSQGAHFLNGLVEKSLERMANAKDWLQWLHLTGQADAEAMKRAYADGGWTAAVFPFFEQMGLCYGACDMVVSRAGASTVAEIIANGLASVLIPYPNAVRDHQTKNARVLSAKGAGCLAEQALLTPSSFSTLLRSLLGDPARLQGMREKAGSLYAGDASRAAAQILSVFCRGE